VGDALGDPELTTMTASVLTSEQSRAPRGPLPDTPSLPARDALPAWPILVLLWGLPVWWALGMLAFAVPVMGLLMAPLLMRQERVRLAPGVLPWVLVVLWMVPASISIGGAGNLISYLLRFATFAGLALVLVYVINAPRLTARRALTALSAAWVTVIVGGYLGLLFPEGRLTRTIGVLLPGALTDNEYIQDLVFPPFAEIQTPWGAEEPYVRPAAPFAYTNGWGAAMSVLTFAALAAAAERGTRKAYFWACVGVAAAVPPAIQSSNRGLFVAIGAGVLYLVLRLATSGHARAAALATGALVVSATVLLAGGAATAISDRQGVANTTEGRGNLYVETFQRALESPILGYGKSQPSAQSEIYLGTQGAVWSALFCFGFVGLGFLLWFLVGIVVRTRRVPTVAGLLLHTSLVATLVMSVYYGLDRSLLPVMVIAGLLLRERYVEPGPLWPGAGRALEKP
jgi:hypothetical protein